MSRLSLQVVIALQLAALFYLKLILLSLITGTISPSLAFMITIRTQYDNFNMPYDSVCYYNFVGLWCSYLELLQTNYFT